MIDDNDDDDDDDDDKDIFEKEFVSILKPKKTEKKNDIFEQSFTLLSDNKTKYLKTPGENGKFLVEIIIWDTKCLKKIPSHQWWTKVNKKTKFLLSSTSDPLYISVNNIFKLGLERIKKIKGV